MMDMKWIDTELDTSTSSLGLRHCYKISHFIFYLQIKLECTLIGLVSNEFSIRNSFALCINSGTSHMLSECSNI